MISVAKAAADPAGHYARPDVTRLLFNNRQAHRVEMLVLPVDRITESAPRVEPTPTPAGGSRENVDPTARPAAAERFAFDALKPAYKGDCCELRHLEACRAAMLNGEPCGGPVAAHAISTIGISEFESWYPSHTVQLFWPIRRLCGKVPTFRALARTDSVSGAH